MNKIAIITARAGSKGLPNKNVLLVDNKPLIAYSIEAALESKEFDKIIVTTDSQEYIDLLSNYDIDFIKRAPHLATDTTSSFLVIEDVLSKYKDYHFDYFVLLQPTSPLRTAKHIREACIKFEKNMDNFDYLVSVSNAHKPTTLTRIIDEDDSLKYFQLDYSNYARQQYLPEYSPNGAIFIAKPAQYLIQKHFYGNKSIAYFMDKNVSIDIDDRDDFEYFCYLVQQKNKKDIQLENIKNRILLKENLFKEKSDITLIGHSILAQWDIKKLLDIKVNNLAISGICTKQYIDLILNKGLISNLGNIVILMIGINDLTLDNYTNEVIYHRIQTLIDKLKKINSNCKIYFLEVMPVALRVNVSNDDIIQLNQYLKTHLLHINWIDLFTSFSDKYGKLDLTYTDDGLHLNKSGYEKLYNILSQVLDKSNRMKSSNS